MRNCVEISAPMAVLTAESSSTPKTMLTTTPMTCPAAGPKAWLPKDSPM